MALTEAVLNQRLAYIGLRMEGKEPDPKWRQIAAEHNQKLAEMLRTRGAQLQTMREGANQQMEEMLRQFEAIPILDEEEAYLNQLKQKLEALKGVISELKRGDKGAEIKLEEQIALKEKLFEMANQLRREFKTAHQTPPAAAAERNAEAEARLNETLKYIKLRRAGGDLEPQIKEATAAHVQELKQEGQTLATKLERRAQEAKQKITKAVGIVASHDYFGPSTKALTNLEQEISSRKKLQSDLVLNVAAAEQQLTDNTKERRVLEERLSDIQRAAQSNRAFPGQEKLLAFGAGMSRQIGNIPMVGPRKQE